MALLKNLVEETLQKLDNYHFEEVTINDEQKDAFIESIQNIVRGIRICGNIFIVESSTDHYVFMPSQYIALAKICFPLACCLKQTFHFVYSNIKNDAIADVIKLQNDGKSCSEYPGLMNIINQLEGDEKENVIYLLEDTKYNKGFANSKKNGFRTDLFEAFILNVVPLTTASNGFFGTFVQGLTNDIERYQKIFDVITIKQNIGKETDDSVESEIMLLFMRFMSNEKKLRSARRYVKVFTSWSKKLVDSNVIKQSLFNYLTVEEYKPLINDIKNSELYQNHYEGRKNRNPKSGLEIDAALSNYLEFLQSDYLKNKMDIVNYSERTIGAPLILYGPPGTGKTYEMQTKYCISYKESPEDLFITTFHQSFSYEEFVEGLKPLIPEGQTEIVYEIEHGIFYEACEQAAILVGYDSLETCIADSQESRRQKMKEAVINKKIVLLCIDEINRANVSSVFGDLISLVESSKRLGAPYEMTVKLPYSKKDFGVPANLMIVGTMNTADRSIQLLDSALRRRFKFEELLPDYECLKNKNENDKAERILRNINNRIRALLDKDHQIGHSYFIGKNTNLELLNVMKENIIPLLEEYFYNETEKIRRVLNETDELYDATSHTEDYFYVLDEEAKDAVGDTDDFNEEKSYYKLNEVLQKELSEESAENFINHLAN